MDYETFTAHAAPYYEKVLQTNETQKQVLCQILQQRLEAFAEIPEKIAFLQALPDYDLAMYCHKKMKTDLPMSLGALEKAYGVLENLADWEQEKIHDALLQTPGGAVEAAVLLGKQETLRRMKIGMEKIQKEQA